MGSKNRLCPSNDLTKITLILAWWLYHNFICFKDIARSSIYDNLQRLIVRGFVVKYSEKRSLTGRPTNVFEVIF
jgi:hypothetical protein